MKFASKDHLASFFANGNPYMDRVTFIARQVALESTSDAKPVVMFGACRNEHACRIVSRIDCLPPWKESEAAGTQPVVYDLEKECVRMITVLFVPKTRAQAQGYAPGESPDELKKLIGDLAVQNELLKKSRGLLG